jgi:hypothetical protein
MGDIDVPVAAADGVPVVAAAGVPVVAAAGVPAVCVDAPALALLAGVAGSDCEPPHADRANVASNTEKQPRMVRCMDLLLCVVDDSFLVRVLPFRLIANH